MSEKLVGISILAMLLVLSAVSTHAASRRDVEAEQVRLDTVCETRRQEILSVERMELVDECVADKFPRDDRAGCERFYADHGNATAGGRAPLHMDIPECLEAHEFRQNRSR